MWKIILKYPGTFQYTFAVPTTKLRRTGEILSFQIALAAARAMIGACPALGNRVNKYQSINLTKYGTLSGSFHYLAAFLINRALTIARPQFSDLLYGFLPQNGTNDGLVTLAPAMTEKMGTSWNKECIAVNVDLEKAFEWAHPLVKVHEASKIGIKGNMLAYIVDYLKIEKVQLSSRVKNRRLGITT